VLRGDTQLLAVVCRYTGVRWSTAWLETGEDACRWTVRWREGEFGTRAYAHATVKGNRAGPPDAGRGRGVHSWRQAWRARGGRWQRCRAVASSGLGDLEFGTQWRDMCQSLWFVG